MTAKKVRLIAILVVIGVALVICLTGIYRVNQGEQAVVLTFGQITDTKEPGVYWHIPMVQSVTAESRTKLYTIEYGFRTEQAATTTTEAVTKDVPEEANMLTGDQNIVSVQAVYQIYVSDVASFLYEVDDQFGTMQCAFETVLRRNLQNRTLDDALLNKQDIAAKVRDDFRNMLKPYKMGVDIREVMIQNISVPTEVDAAYQDVNNATNEKTTKLDEAAKYKNKVVPEARAEAYKLIQDAEAYRAKTVASAQGEVAQFNDVYTKYVNNKQITKTRLLIETLESILSNSKQIYMADDNSGVLKLLTLNSTPSPAATPAPQATAAPGGN